MEMKRDFPGLGAAMEIERDQMLRQVDRKIEGQKLGKDMLRGKDIVFELLEQSLVHEELDKLRRDLDEYSYKTKDHSHILNLPYINPDEQKKEPEAKLVPKAIEPIPEHASEHEDEGEPIFK
jgi:hypothetical protein